MVDGMEIDRMENRPVTARMTRAEADRSDGQKDESGRGLHDVPLAEWKVAAAVFAR